jgi:hypothetical protein
VETNNDIIWKLKKSKEYFNRKLFWQISVERGDDGQLLDSAKCVSCQTGSQPSPDKSQCLPCKQLPMLTPADYTEGTGCNCRWYF